MRTRLLAACLPFLLLTAAAARSEDTDGCLACHGLPGFNARVGKEVRPLGVDPAIYQATPHARLSCRHCHRQISAIPHGEGKSPVACGLECHGISAPDGTAYSHATLYWEFMTSAHGRISGGSPCLSCHARMGREEMTALDARARGMVCVPCHLGRSAGDAARIGEFNRSVHGRAIAGGSLRVPSCPDCHTLHTVRASSQEKSSTHRAAVSATCAGSLLPRTERSCHREASTARLAGMSPRQMAAGRQLVGFDLFLPGWILFLALGVRTLAVLVRRP
jgi:hypothetical protein